MAPLTRLYQGDYVMVSYDGVVWWSGIYLDINPDGSYLVSVNKTGMPDTFTYDRVKPTQHTIDKYATIYVPSIEMVEEDEDTIGGLDTPDTPE